MSKTEKTILIISGSPHKNGNSAKMLQCFTELLEGLSVEHSLVTRHYNAFDCGFAPCTDCRACCVFEGCVNRDMDEFFRDFETADGMILATPIYNMSFPAPLKTILDRMQRYYNARFSLGKRPPIAKHRPAVLLMSAGDPNEDGEIAVRQLCRSFTVTNCTLVAHALWAGTDDVNCHEIPPLEMQEELCQCVNKFAVNLF